MVSLSLHDLSPSALKKKTYNAKIRYQFHVNCSCNIQRNCNEPTVCKFDAVGATVCKFDAVGATVCKFDAVGATVCKFDAVGATVCKFDAVGATVCKFDAVGATVCLSLTQLVQQFV